MSLAGHFWTIAPNLAHRFAPQAAPPALPWSTVVRHQPSDPQPSVRLSGALCPQGDTDTLVVVVHGLGGAIESGYCIRAAGAIAAHGYASLRIALRGADRSGEDFYHAGLHDDLQAAFQSPELARYERLFVLGYSLGGHVSLHAAVSCNDPRVRAVAAVCAPLDLERSAAAIDMPSRWLYRQHILKGLKEIYAAVARRRAVPTPMARIARVQTIREWDRLTVVPRYGFQSVQDYYARASIGPRLSELQRPTLLVQSRHDPMVPPSTFESLLQEASPRLTVHFTPHGGHVGYPKRIQLAGKTRTSVEEHVLDWFAQH